ncbi:hypothetical protein PR048_011239 [Dryococelus australis]|uniref:Reverse transcriptase/retrotransposon-derived protein RNase H-like domain-containing protein n=1 Tax=Dryococelus australis TaxID=614101 RepID=A0ABQ9HL05_9NEOP|nr:hypothetical protein PR048_011239 [Dryococelus australis]
MNFIDPDTRANTQRIACVWRDVRRGLPRYGMRTSHFIGYLLGFIVRRWYPDEQFSVSLKNLSSSCEFCELKDSIIKSIFICGLLPQHDNIRQVLLQEDLYTLEKALEVAKTLNQTEKNAELFEKGQHDYQMLVLRSSGPMYTGHQADLGTGRRDDRHAALQCLSTITNIMRYGLSNHCIAKYEDLFSGIGSLPSQVNLTLDPGKEPLIEPQRKGIGWIRLIEVVSKIAIWWASSIIVIEKPSGKLRICLDPLYLNKAIIRPRFPMPDFEDVKSKLIKAKFFTCLDATSTFWAMPLDHESFLACTFNTPFCYYRWCKLPMGINSASDIYQCEMAKPPSSASSVSELQRIMGVVNYVGPFIKNLSANTSNLRKLLQKMYLLTYFNPDEPTTLSVDASKDALGAVLLQNNKPIAYASTTLTPAQCNYSQIQK